MKKYLKIIVTPLTGDQSDILMARLSDIGFYAFEEESETLNAFILQVDFNENLLRSELPKDARFEIEIIPEENWNQQWEEQFRPVIITDFAAVRAHFHDEIPSVKHEIIITPKMSFGTGHHATTFMMMDLMNDVDFDKKTVIDFGTGTGVLAILAEKLGADSIIAIDNDEWSIDNSKENLLENRCKKITVVQDESLVNSGSADIVLANINLNILLANAQDISTKTTKGGVLLLSGILEQDIEKIDAEFIKVGFRKDEEKKKSGWVAIKFRKI